MHAVEKVQNLATFLMESSKQRKERNGLVTLPPLILLRVKHFYYITDCFHLVKRVGGGKSIIRMSLYGIIIGC